MEKLTIKDMTPAFMKELSLMDSVEKIMEFCKEKGYEISAAGAEKLLDQFRKVLSIGENELSDDALDAVVGGFGTFS
jgi:hypothetical protein